MPLHLKNSRLLRVSSRDRSVESFSPYAIVYKTNDSDLHQIKKVILKSAIIPNTQYNVNKYNNTFHFPNTLNATTDYVVPVGQYTTETLINTLQTMVSGLTITQ